MQEALLIDVDRAPTLTKDSQLAYAGRMSPEEDSALMLAYAKRGDVSAFERLYRRHKDSVFRYLLRQCGSRQTAEDVSQEAWSRVIRSRERYQPTARFSTFLFRIARNCLIDNFRRSRRHAGAAEIDDERLAADESGPVEDAEKAIMRRRLVQALAELPEEQRDVFLLFEEAGLSLEEIARVTDSKHEAVKSRLRYANQKLRRALAIPENAR